MTTRPGRSAATMLLLGALTGSGAIRARAQATAVASEPVGAVQGTVTGRFQGRVRAVPYALVEATWGSVHRSVTADGSGRYRVEGVPPGEIGLSAVQAGYARLALVVSVPPGRVVEVDLELSGAPLSLPKVEVRSDPLLTAPSSAPADERGGLAPQVELEALDLGPGLAEGGLADVVAALPGNDPADATDVLYMRGSTADMKLVLLDGVPLYTPFHVAGLIRPFEPGVLGKADLHVGGAPARFDGGLTHILELETRTPRTDRLHVSGAADLLSASAAVESPLGPRAGVIATGRSLLHSGTIPFGGEQPYGYRDLLVTGTAKISPEGELRATGFWNAESVALDPGRAPDDARWGNRAGSLRYRGAVGAAEVEVTAGMSGYEAELPLMSSVPAGDSTTAAVLASSAWNRARFIGEVSWGPPGAAVRAGASSERLEAAFQARPLAGGVGAVSRGSTNALGVYVDATRPIAHGLTLRAGMRADHFSGRGALLAPRVALRWELGPTALLTIATGRYHQPTRTPEVEVEGTLAEVAGVPGAELLPVATSDHVVVDLDQKIGESVRLDLQGFWRGYRGLPSAQGESVRSSGVDIAILSSHGDRSAWLGYDLAWYWSTVDLSGRAGDFAGRQLLTAGLSGRLHGPLWGEGRVGYGAGIPYTSVPFGGVAGADSPVPLNQSGAPGGQAADSPLTSGPDDSFLRVDLEIYGILEPEWGGKQWRVRPYLRVLNALDRRDALFYMLQPWRSNEVIPLAKRPLLPVLGVAVSF